jgi:hypothetical protein
MRIYAMYNFSKRVLIILYGAGLIAFILAVVKRSSFLLL